MLKIRKESRQLTADLLASKKLAIIIQVFHPTYKIYNDAEILGLADTAGYQVCEYIPQNLKKKNIRYFMGSGKAQLIKTAIDHHFDGEILLNVLNDKQFTPQDMNDEEFSNNGALDGCLNEENPWADLSSQSRNESNEEDGVGSEDVEALHLDLPEFLTHRKDLVIIFNNRLSYTQMMNLHGLWDIKVIDRDELVLEIFEKHAQTRESKLQIELARLTLQTNIIKKEMGQHLQEKQGRDFKGKGMKAWEPQMRAYRGRKRKILLELNKISQQRNLRRKGRSKFFNVGVVGYTNAGKSTLVNQLAKTTLETANQEFTTVTTTSRKVTFPIYDEYGRWKGEEMILTDSVGFISDMSYLMIDAFLSTLEELQFSDMIMIVVDIGEESMDQVLLKITSSFDVINQINAADIPKIFIFNKIDRLSPENLHERVKFLTNSFPAIPSVSISALNKSQFEKLAQMMITKKQELYHNH